MIYDSRILIDELLKRLGKKEKKKLVCAPRFISKIDTSGIRRESLLLTLANEYEMNRASSNKARRKKKTMLFNEIEYNSTKQFYKEDAIPIDKRLSREMWNKDYVNIDCFKASNGGSNGKNHTSLRKLKRTPFEVSQCRSLLLKRSILAKQFCNTVSSIDSNFVLSSTPKKRVHNFTYHSFVQRPNTSMRFSNPQCYFNNRTLSKTERKIALNTEY